MHVALLVHYILQTGANKCFFLKHVFQCLANLYRSIPAEMSQLPEERDWFRSFLEFMYYNNSIYVNTQEGGGNSIVFKYLSGNHSSLPV